VSLSSLGFTNQVAKVLTGGCGFGSGKKCDHNNHTPMVATKEQKMMKCERLIVIDFSF